MDITEKVWWIAINGQSEGEYSFLDLERDDRVTPETPVWKEGWPDWKKIKEVEELNQLFKDKRKQESVDEEDTAALFPEDNELTVSESSRFPPWIIFWIVVIFLSLVYLWLNFHS